MSVSTLPDMLSKFPEGERPRVEQQATRYWILLEHPDEILRQHIAEHVSRERLRRWPQPDVSQNPIAAVCRAKSTPGHYGRAPRLLGDDAEAVSSLFETAWPLKQHAEYLAQGLGAVLLYHEVPEGLDYLVHTVVPPHETWVETHPSDPRRAETVYRLRVREIPDKTQPGETIEVYAWDIWTLNAGGRGEPAFMVRLAHDNGEVGDDITALVAPHPDGGTWSGPDYPATDEDGPFLPYSVHRARDDGTFYAWREGRSAFVGTLQVMKIANYADKAALDATGRSAIVTGVTIEGVDIDVGADGQGSPSVPIEAGSITLASRKNPDEQPWAYELNSGDQLLTLQTYLEGRKSDVKRDAGIGDDAAVRVGANPVSGAALAITNAQKREIQRMQEPLCRRADAEMIRKSLALARAAGLIGPTGPISISYHEVERSPDEERQDREAKQWRVQMGLMSEVDLYLDENPGVTREAAIAELRRVAQERAAIGSPADAVAPVPGTQQTPPQPADEPDEQPDEEG